MNKVDNILSLVKNLGKVGSAVSKTASKMLPGQLAVLGLQLAGKANPVQAKAVDFASFLKPTKSKTADTIQLPSKNVDNAKSDDKTPSIGSAQIQLPLGTVNPLSTISVSGDNDLTKNKLSKTDSASKATVKISGKVVTLPHIQPKISLGKSPTLVVAPTPDSKVVPLTKMALDIHADRIQAKQSDSAETKQPLQVRPDTAVRSLKSQPPAAGITTPSVIDALNRATPQASNGSTPQTPVPNDKPTQTLNSTVSTQDNVVRVAVSQSQSAAQYTKTQPESPVIKGEIDPNVIVKPADAPKDGSPKIQLKDLPLVRVVAPKAASYAPARPMPSTKTVRPEDPSTITSKSTAANPAIHRSVDLAGPPAQSIEPVVDRAAGKSPHEQAKSTAKSEQVLSPPPQESDTSVKAANPELQPVTNLKSASAFRSMTTPYASHTAPQTPLEAGELAQNIRLSLAGGKRELSLQLNPAALGRALIMMSQDGDNLKLEFRLERPEARQAIEAQAAQLRDTLIAAGFQSVTIDVKTDDGASLWNERTGGERQPRDEHRGQDKSHDDGGQNNRSFHPRNLGYNTFEIAA